MAIKFGRPLERNRLTPVEAEKPAERLDLAIRPRRNRRAEWTRRLVRENVLTTDDLIWPLFLVDGTKVRAPVDSMPDVERLSVDEAVRAAERAAKLTIPCLALFPYTEPGRRDDDGSEALNPDNLVCRAIRAIRKKCRRSACSATWRSIPIPATAMTGCCAMASSSTTRPSASWSARRWSRPTPVATSSRRPT